MNLKNLKIISFSYLIIPIIVFILGWVKLSLAIIPTLGLVVILIRKILEENDKNNKFIEKKYVIIIFLNILLICILGGIGGFFYQSPDWHARNAVFRDLVNFDWPVYYETDAALTYYIAIWMVPAVIR